MKHLHSYAWSIAVATSPAVAAPCRLPVELYGPAVAAVALTTTAVPKKTLTCLCHRSYLTLPVCHQVHSSVEVDCLLVLQERTRVEVVCLLVLQVRSGVEVDCLLALQVD